MFEQLMDKLLNEKAYMGRAYWISKSGKVFDVSSDMGGGTDDHVGYLALAYGEVPFKDFGINQKDIEALKELYETGEGTPESGMAASKILKNGNIRVRAYQNEIDITSSEVVSGVAKKVMDLMLDKNIKAEKVVWDNVDGSFKEMSYDEFASMT